MRSGGSKPKPTELKLLAGNPGKRALNELEPKPEVISEIPAPPKYLKGEAKKEWARVAPSLVKTRVLSEQDISLLAAYCHLHAKFVAAARKNEILTASLIGQYRTLGAEFGLTPSSRTRIKAAPKDDGEKDDEKFFRKPATA